MSYVTTRDNVQLHVKDWGEGRPVVMLHGWPLTGDTFDDLSMAVADAGMRAIAYDRRGFGRSDQPWSGYDYNTLTDDLAAVLDQTSATDVTLVGFSMGGGEVARYMSRYQGRNVRQAILVASVVPFMLKTADNPDGVDQKTFDTIAAAIRADRARFWSEFFPDFYGVGPDFHGAGDFYGAGAAGPVSEDVLDWSGRLSMQASLKATLACAESFASTDFRPDLVSFKVPTLVIHGTADKIVPIDASGRKAAAGIARSTLVEYDGAPHGLLASHKKELVRDILTFLKS